MKRKKLLPGVFAVLLASPFAYAQEGGELDATAQARGNQPGMLGMQRETERRSRELQRQAARSVAQQRHRQAITQLKELVVLDPYEADYHISLGILHGKVNDQDEARRKFQDFMDLGGNLAVAHLLLAETHVASKDRNQAFKHLRQAAENGLNLMKAAKESPVLATFRQDTEFIKLALQLEQYQLDIGSRRDPMTQVFVRASQSEEAPQADLENLANRLSKEDQEEVLRGAKRCLVRIEIFLSREDEQRAMEAYRELQTYIEKSEKVTVPMLASELRAIVEQKEQIELRIKEIRLKYYYSEAQEMVAEMERFFGNQDYAQVDLKHAEVKKVAEMMVGIDSQFQEVSTVIMRVSDEWQQRAQIRREFDAKVLKVQGIVTHEGAPVAILNNRMLGVGSEFQEMVVVQINNNQIVFNYRGEEIPLVFRRY